MAFALSQRKKKNSFYVCKVLVIASGLLYSAHKNVHLFTFIELSQLTPVRPNTSVCSDPYTHIVY